MSMLSLRPLCAVSLLTTCLPLTAAQPISQSSAHSNHQIDHDYQNTRNTLSRRSDAQKMTAAVVGTTVAVGVFILFLLCIAVYLWRRKQLGISGRRVPAVSPRANIYREQHGHKSPSAKTARRREERQTRRSSNEKKRTRTDTPNQPSSTAASIASSFSPARPENPVASEMAQVPSPHYEPPRFRPPVALPPLITQPQNLQSIDATVNMAFHPTRQNTDSRWSMSTLGASLLRDTLSAPDPDRYSESSPSSKYPDTTPSAYGPSPGGFEPSPVKHVNFAPVELQGCNAQSTTPWRVDPSPESPGGWSRGPSEDDLITPVFPRHLTTFETDERQVTSPLNTIYEER